jgi:two-component sensor histidine kinase
VSPKAAGQGAHRADPAGGAPRFQSIRFRLAAAVALALLPILLLSVLQSIAAFRAEAAHQRADLLSAAERSAASASARLESASILLETLGPETIGVQCARRLSALTQRLSGYQTLARYSATGRVMCASASMPSADDQPWFRALRDGQARVVVRAPPGWSSDPAVLAAVRVDRGQGFEGAFIALVPVSSLKPTDSDRALPRDAEVAVVDAEGRLLNATDRSAFAPATAWIPQAVREGSALFNGEDTRGRRRVYAGAPLLADDVFVLLSAERQGLFSWAVVNPIATLLLPLGAWAAAVAAVMIVTERVVIRWLGYLERIAAIYVKGRFTVRPIQARNAPFEIRVLADTLDQMASGIEHRDQSLKDSLTQKDALLREIHHRVKNNLQVISSLLNMQQRALTDPAARAALGDTRQRITALALIYRALYQSPDLRRVDVGHFLDELIGQLVSSESGRGPLVRTELEADALVIDPDKLAPLALWAVEAITNAQKHAFNGRGGLLKVRFKVDRAESRLEVEDDGPGAEAAALGEGVGRTLMTAFARQLRGRAEIVPVENGGLLARLVFPTPEAADHPASAEAREGNQAAA